MIPNILFGLLLFLASLVTPTTDYYQHDEAIKSVESYQSGNFWEITGQRIYDWNQVNSIENSIILFFTIFPFLLIGAGISKLKLVRNNMQNKKALMFLLLSFVTVGSLLKLLPFAVRNLFSEYVQDIFGGPLLAVSYALLVIILMEKYSARLVMFQAVGKLAISNYLFQSIVATLIFYNYGLGLYSKISVGTGTILAITIFLIQAYISTIWVRNFHFGPVEYLWRAFSYWNIPNWKKFTK
jgi:uncharacterized protein